MSFLTYVCHSVPTPGNPGSGDLPPNPFSRVWQVRRMPFANALARQFRGKSLRRPRPQ